ncbi:MAG: sigma-70 family RNA polymerase sigma factor [Actinomycetota bacterium]
MSGLAIATEPDLPAGGRSSGDPTADDLARAVAAVRAGDRSAWTELWSLLESTVTGVARGRFRLDGADVDDIGQEVWLRLQLHLDRIDEPRAVRAWVRTTATRECLRLLRQRGRTEALGDRLDDEIDLTDAPERHAERAEVCRAMRSAVGRLSPRRRRLVRMLFVEDRDYAEIASELQMPIGSIGPTRCRLMAGLRSDAEVAALA